MRATRIIAQLPSAELRQPLIDGLIAGDLTQQDIAANVRSLQQMPTAAPETPNDTVSDASDDETSTVADEGSAVIAHTAQHHEVRHASPTIVGAPSAFSRTLDRDMIQLVSTLSRWRMGAPKSGADEQMRMLQFIQEKLRPQLEVLTQELMERQT